MNVDKLVPEGVEGRVAYKGSAVWVMQQLIGGVRASMGYTGAVARRDAQEGEFVRSRRPASANRTCTTCRSSKRRRTIVSSKAGCTTGS
jgi:IMP dehydrogenase/GMP reductase